MDKQKEGDKEKETPATLAQGEEENKPAEEINFEADLKKAQQELKETQGKLKEKITQASQLTDEIQKLRIQVKQPLLKSEEKPKPNSKPEDNPDNFSGEEEDDFDAKYENRRSKEKKDDYVKMVNRCFDKFTKEKGDEFDGETDLAFRNKANNMHLGDSDIEVMENFQFIFNGLKPSSKKENYCCR